MTSHHTTNGPNPGAGDPADEPDARSNLPAPAGDGPAHRYDATLANDIETKWQDWWAEHDTFRQPNPGEPGFDASKPRFYILDMFPYPSGAGLHVGHPEGYTASDIVSRYKRMNGYNVLHPMGYDAFGLPAEQYAVQTGIHPEETTRSSIENFGRQLRRFGFDYDWSREVRTIDPGYYKWTQWIWLRAYNAWFDPYAANREGGRGAARPIAELIDRLEREQYFIGPFGDIMSATQGEHDIAGIAGDPSIGGRKWSELTRDERRRVIDQHRLAYLGEQVVNWCPKLGTALANEEVIDGRSERGGFPVKRLPLRQWMFRITAYADRLLEGLRSVDWPESTRTMQREWIGRSEGAEIDFELAVSESIINRVSEDGAPGALRVFTTRPDTVFGATYMVVAPEHPLVDALVEQPEPETDAAKLRDYALAARNRSDVERQEAKQKTGVFTGAYCVNPATGDRIPVWCADYVLAGYGTGAIMAVPAHDERDMEFALAFDLTVRDVVYPKALHAFLYYAQHAEASETVSDDWRNVLADFVGLITSQDTPFDGFDDALRTVRTRRAGSPPADARQPMDESLAKDAVDALAGADLAELTGLVGRQRGGVREQWLEALDAMGFVDFNTMRSALQRAAVYHDAQTAYTGAGFAVNSSNDHVSIDRLPVADAKARITAWFEDRGLGSKTVNYKLRDWLFSRQRYWGEPFPVVFDETGTHYGLQDSALPVELPPLADYTPVESDIPVPLLSKAEDWVSTTAGEAGVDDDELRPDTPVLRETNTMPGWAGSCWYYLRYADPRNDERFASREAQDYWLAPTEDNRVGGVDLYIGGAEHATLHLLYARFWHKILFDLGEVNTPEPFAKLFHQGLILSHAFQRSDKSLVPTDQVEQREEHEFVETATGEPVERVVAKMSKSLKNVVNPDDIIRDYGADAFRLYEMYMGPLDASKPWATKDLVGLYRFLQRAWRLVVDENSGEPHDFRNDDQPDETVERQLHRTIAKVGEDVERLAFNTAIAAMIEWVNAASKAGVTRSQAERFVRTLCPFAPHIAEEMWARLGQPAPCSRADWPAFDDAMLRDDEIEIPVQIMGKVKARVMAPADADAETLESIALADEQVKRLIEGKTVRKVVAVPGRMVNIVAN